MDSNAIIFFDHLTGVTSKSAIAVSQVKGVHFGKTSGRSTPRRSSSRSIKRKKFDDELVESSLKNPGKPLGMPEIPEGKEKLKKVCILTLPKYTAVSLLLVENLYSASV